MILDKIRSSIQFRVLNRFSTLSPLLKTRNDLTTWFAKNDVNICYNKYIQKTYDPEKQNVLLAIESPAMIKHHKWIAPDMKFVAEISFCNYFNLTNYLCPRTLYANNDNFVEMGEAGSGNEKSSMVSMIYSDKIFLDGYQIRHEVSREFAGKIDLFGSGTGRRLKRKSDSLRPYRFQIVIENGKFPEYVSEKFHDCLKTRTIPIYWGGEEAVRKMGFDQNGILFFDDMEGLGKILEEKANAGFYQERLSAVEFNRERLMEIRNEDKLLMALNTIKLGYCHTIKSYAGEKATLLNLKFEGDL